MHRTQPVAVIDADNHVNILHDDEFDWALHAQSYKVTLHETSCRSGRLGLLGCHRRLRTTAGRD